MDNEIVPQEVYDFLDSHKKPKPEKKATDFTVEIAANFWNETIETSRRRLNKMADNGEVEKIKFGRKYLYRPIEKTLDKK